MKAFSNNSANGLGFDWIGPIPAHWNRVRNSGLFQERNERGREDLELLAVTIAHGVLPQHEYMEMSGRRLSSSESGDLSNYKVVRRGDLVYNRMRMWQGAVGLSPCDGIVSPAYVVLRPKPGVHPRYFEYLFKTPAFICEAGRYSYGIADDQNSLRFEDFKTLYSVVPPFEDQRRIAAFLDYETARIDQLVHEQLRLKSLLAEKHQATIKYAVENGIRHAPDEITRIPFKFVARIKNGRDYKAVEASDGPYPVIGSGGEFARSSTYLYEGESVLLGRKGTIDKPLYVNGRFWTVDTMFYTEIVPGNDPKYVYYLSTTLPFDALSTRTALPSMTQEALGAVTVLVPPLEEQRQIVASLDAATARVDQLYRQLDRNIALLRERRSALVSAAVTGQLDLCNWQRPENAEAAEVA